MHNKLIFFSYVYFFIFFCLIQSGFSAPYSYPCNQENAHLALGMGFDPRSNGCFLSGLDVFPVEIDGQDSQIESSSFYIALIRNHNQIEVSGRIGLFSLDSKSERNSLSFVVVAQKNFLVRRIAQPRLSEKYSQLPLETLKHQFGPEIVVQERRGAIVTAKFNIQNLTQSQKEKVVYQIGSMQNSGPNNSQAIPVPIGWKQVFSIDSTSSGVVHCSVVGGSGEESLKTALADIANGGLDTMLPVILNKVQVYMDQITYDNARPMWFWTIPIERILEPSAKNKTLFVRSFDDVQFKTIHALYEDLCETSGKMIRVAIGCDPGYEKPTPEERIRLFEDVEKYEKAMLALKAAKDRCFQEEIQNDPYICDLKTIMEPLPTRIGWPRKKSTSIWSFLGWY